MAECANGKCANGHSSGTPHPLDPLSAEEVGAACAAVKGATTPEDVAGLRFMEVALNEPSKEVVVAADEGALATIPREAKVTTYNRQNNETAVHLVNLTPSGAQVVESKVVPGVQPPIHPTEFEECEEALRKDPRFVEALKRRGIEDMDMVLIDPWSVGYYSAEEGPSRRLAMPLCFVKGNSTCSLENAYARPVDGLWIVFDLQRMEAVTIEDRQLVPLPPLDPLRNYTEARDRGGVDREDLQPVEITQDQGPSFAVDGYHVHWQKWDFRIGFSAREGLVLHTVSYADGDKGKRGIAHRISLAEMVVPYSDPDHYRKNAFDEGEYGLGKNAHSLTLDCDCLGHIKYFDAHLSTFDGSALTIKNAVCMHEEDYGILWKHMEWRTGQTEVRRSRRLVLSFICTVANYEYGFFWNLYQDGRIELTCKLTGILSLGACLPQEQRKYGVLVAPGDAEAGGVYAPYHQHFFVARLDMNLDCKAGEKANQVYEADVVTEPKGETNPHGNLFYVKETLLKSELEAGRDLNPLAIRQWKVKNPNKLNRMGLPVAYKLVPGANCRVFAHEEAMFRRRAGFLAHSLWVTGFNKDEMFPAGEFPNQSPHVGEGLSSWVKRDAPLDGADVVLWYIMGITHITRPEDWPVMPCEYISFNLAPSGFFDCSPCIDVPPAKACAEAAAGPNGTSS